MEKFRAEGETMILDLMTYCHHIQEIDKVHSVLGLSIYGSGCNQKKTQNTSCILILEFKSVVILVKTSNFKQKWHIVQTHEGNSK